LAEHPPSGQKALRNPNLLLPGSVSFSCLLESEPMKLKFSCEMNQTIPLQTPLFHPRGLRSRQSVCDWVTPLLQEARGERIVEYDPTAYQHAKSYDTVQSNIYLKVQSKEGNLQPGEDYLNCRDPPDNQ